MHGTAEGIAPDPRWAWRTYCAGLTGGFEDATCRLTGVWGAEGREKGMRGTGGVSAFAPSHVGRGMHGINAGDAVNKDVRWPLKMRDDYWVESKTFLLRLLASPPGFVKPIQAWKGKRESHLRKSNKIFYCFEHVRDVEWA